ncbi:MAG: amidohydrolase [Pseudomonadales bacterium]
MARYSTVAISITTVAVLAACQHTDNSTGAKQAADLVLNNGRIFTQSAPEWAEAVAISDGKFSFVGDNKAVNDYIGPATKVVDLHGNMAMPGIIDAHVHAVEGAIKKLFQCNFPFTATPDEITAQVASCVEQSSAGDWIVGGQWDSDLFVNHKVDSPKALLDTVSADKAVYLTADSGHDGWANSKALQLAGIDNQTANPEGGEILRAENGEPNGLLLERAQQLMRKVIPPWSDQQYVQAAEEVTAIANQFGITGFKDASAEEFDVKALHSVSAAERLTVHAAAAIVVQDADWKGAGTKTKFTLTRMLELRNKYANKNVDLRFVKIFTDGVPTSSRTAAMLADYLPSSKGEKRHNGELHYTLEQLREMLIALDKAGFTVKIHTAGDRAVRVALDAIETTRNVNGDSGLRHELAHAGYIHPQDLPRFTKLNVVADLSPYIWYPSPIIDSVIGAVGPRGRKYWPIQDLLRDQALVLAGSDWPSAVASMSPWIGMEAMVTRADPSANSVDTLWSEQAISLPQALKIYTLDGARALRLQQQAGSIETGKSADLIVLNDNLFDIPATSISDTRVLATWFEGNLVYKSGKLFASIPLRD